MQYKINIQFTIITLISIILCTCITAYVFYGALNREVFLDLKLYAEMLASEDLLSDSKLNIPDGIRVTLIDNDRNALYDSMTDVTALENHNKRPEVIDAFRSGEGQARRRSSTLSNDAYYYAIKLDKGYVLRVAKEGSSLTSLITSILPMLAVLLILLSIIFIGFSRVMTNNIVRPISQLAVDTANVNEDEIYPELRPFVKKIQSQHEEILKDATMRQEFTANVSHELKTPLTAISGYSELLENGMIPPDQVSTYAKQIHKNSARLLTLINDIIKLSELDSVKSDISETVSLTEITQQCLGTLEFQAEQQNISLHLDVINETSKDSSHVRRLKVSDPQLYTETHRDSNQVHRLKVGDPQLYTETHRDSNQVCRLKVSDSQQYTETYQKSDEVRCLTVGDPRLYEELIYNLCDNAVRYNNPGGHVYVTLREEADEIILIVRDTGIGIPKPDQERIFERFYRVDKSRSKQTGGTGLGLAIVKHIVEHLGARIELESETGMGTEIRVHFMKAGEMTV